MAGTSLALSVYYLDYGAEFTEGESQSSPLTLAVRVAAVALLVGSVGPIRVRVDSTFALTVVYCFALLSYLLAVAVNGSANDTFFLNTVLQLPVLVALAGTRLRIDYGKWLRFLVVLVALEAMVDAAVVAAGSTLWISGAFIGGVGNPSSFGLICALMCAFCLLHPQAGWGRRPFAVGFAAAAIMTKSLFALFATGFIGIIWATRNWRRFVTSIVLCSSAGIAVYGLALGSLDDDPGFVANKLRAALALLGFVSYDDSSSDTVGGRLEIHQRTFDALHGEPWRLLFGHLQGLVYWPVDSQVITYLGSFGFAMLLVFLLVHLIWARRALRYARCDGGFGFVALLLFSFIFFTNRILDYFPIAIVYFICVTSCNRGDNSLPAPASRPVADRWPGIAPAGGAPGVVRG
jgi:hypothetical protein